MQLLDLLLQSPRSGVQSLWQADLNTYVWLQPEHQNVVRAFQTPKHCHIEKTAVGVSMQVHRLATLNWLCMLNYRLTKASRFNASLRLA